MRLALGLSSVLACRPDAAEDSASAQGDTQGDACATATLGPDGGALTGDGIRIDVPPGALQWDTALRLCPVRGPDEPQPVGGAWELGPPIELLAPAVVTLTSAPSAAALFVPGPSGTPIRSLQAEVPFDGGLAAPLYRGGTVFAALDRRVVERYGTGGPFDLLLVIDDSGSMAQNQVRFTGDFAELFGAFVSERRDFHAGVVTTDVEAPDRSGKLREVDGARWVDADTPDAVEVLDAMIDVGVLGSSDERGLQASFTALALLDPGYNEGFHRADAELAVVVLSDEDDHTPLLGPADYASWLSTTTSAKATLHAIVSTTGGYYRCDRYIAAADATGGVVADLGEDWSPVVDALADLGRPGSVLSNPAWEDTVEAWWVPPSDEPLQLPLTYDPADGSVEVDLGGAPIAEVVVLYQPR